MEQSRSAVIVHSDDDDDDSDVAGLRDRSNQVLDEYGFAIDPKLVADYQAWVERNEKRVESLRAAWKDPAAMLKIPNSQRKAKLKDICVNGFPPEFRDVIWGLSSGATKKKEYCNANCESGFYYGELVERNKKEGGKFPESFYEIQKDVDRTFPGHKEYDSPEGQEKLKRVLEAFARRNKSIGYCQAMNFVTGFLLLTVEEEEAFYQLTQVCEELCAGTYSKAMVSIQVDSFVLNDLLAEKLPEIHRHLDSLPGALLLIITKWFMCLFIGILPSETMLRVWDLFFLQGQVALFTAALAIFSMFHDDVLKSKNTVVLINNLKKKVAGLFDAKPLLQLMLKLEVSEDQLEELRSGHRDYFNNKISQEALAEMRDRLREATSSSSTKAAEIFNQLAQSTSKALGGKLDSWFQKSVKSNYLNFLSKNRATKARRVVLDIDSSTEKHIFQTIGHWKVPVDFIVQGTGMRLYQNGKKYQGGFSSGKRDGFGTLYDAQGRTEYDGYWKADKRDGKGSGDDHNGTTYSGQWHQDLYNGKGLLKIVVSGQTTTYDGEFKNSRHDGRGVMSFANGDRYEGQWKAGFQEGRGTMYYTNGEKYDGDWKQSEKDGLGTFWFADGSRYEGEWKQSKQEGKGVLFMPGGSRYDGEWKQGKRTGKGTLYMANGERFEGEWRNNVQHGKGVHSWPSGDRLEGEWKAGRQNGKAVIIYANGDRFEGNTDNLKPMGHGQLTFANGDVYVGDFIDGLREGSGQMVFANGDFFQGQWQNGKQDGKGTLVFANGAKYQGRWKEDKMDGEGTYIWVEGATYEGEWKMGKQEGKGVMTYHNGNRFSGDWVNSKRHGYGDMKWYTGETYSGNWRDGKRNGKGTMTFANGDRYEGEWKNDSCHGTGTYFDKVAGTTWKGQFADGFRVDKEKGKTLLNGDPIPATLSDSAVSTTSS